MMIVEYKEDGRISTIRMPPISEGLVDGLRALGLRLLEVADDAEVDFDAHYVLNGALADRPKIHPGGALTMKRGTTLTIAAGVGARLLIDGQDLGASPDGSIEIEAAEVGAFDVVIFPPFPAQDLDLAVTVTA